jgi:hypothetical protein
VHVLSLVPFFSGLEIGHDLLALGREARKGNARMSFSSKRANVSEGKRGEVD